MAEAFDVTNSNTIMMYTFRFDSSDKLVHLTQQQLDSIPYLTALLTHKDDMSSIQNENGEYILNPPIYYQWFMPILHSITSKNPYTLFNELSEDNNVLDTLQLFDYLSIDSFPLPLLKDEDLMQSNSNTIEDPKTRITYHKANLSEARQTAAEFIIALAKNEYKLHDSNTKESIFTLIKVILSEVAIFSSRFRHHTLVVVKECVYSFFSKSEQRQLQTTVRIAQNRKTNSSVHLSDDSKPVPYNFRNTFGWRGIYVPIKENRTNSLPVDFSNRSPASLLKLLDDYLFYEPMEPILSSIFDLELTNQDDLFAAIYYIEYQFCDSLDDIIVCIDDYNKLPKRQNVDKLKARFGPKTQKHR